MPDPIDPYADPTAIDSRFRQRVARGYGRARLRIVGPLSVRLTSGALRKRFEQPSPGDIPPGTDIAEHYQLEDLPAFEQGTSYTYNELELRYDSRRNGDEFEPTSIPSTGWLMAAWGGAARGFAGAPTRYNVYGGDVQRFIRLGANPRVLTLRLRAEEVRGDDDEIPFVDLPRLGGPTLLRGYDRDRFRDRAMALGSAEYLWDIGRMWSAFVFTDAGRVYPTLTDARFEDIRVGYGGGLQFTTDKSLIGRFNVASSIDGGIFFSLSLDPVYDPTARMERD
jgi:outer membrane translocation and assembly module TamA